MARQKSVTGKLIKTGIALLWAGTLLLARSAALHRPLLTEEMLDGLTQNHPAKDGWYRELDTLDKAGGVYHAISDENIGLFGAEISRPVKNEYDALEIAHYYITNYRNNTGKLMDINRGGWFYYVLYSKSESVYDVSLHALGGYGIGIDSVSGKPIYFYHIYDEHPAE